MAISLVTVDGTDGFRCAMWASSGAPIEPPPAVAFSAR